MGELDVYKRQISGVKHKISMVSEKVRLICNWECGISNSTVSKKYSLSACTVLTIQKDGETNCLCFQKKQTNCTKIKS